MSKKKVTSNPPWVSNLKDGKLRVIIIDDSKNQLSVKPKDIRDADIIVHGRRVTKHRFGRQKVLTKRGLERVRSGDYSPLFVK